MFRGLRAFVLLFAGFSFFVGAGLAIFGFFFFSSELLLTIGAAFLLVSSFLALGCVFSFFIASRAIFPKTLEIEKEEEGTKGSEAAEGGSLEGGDRIALAGAPLKVISYSSSPMKKTRVIAVTSGKGGVGKTMVAANLSVCLARKGKKIALLDADFGLSNCHILLGVRPKARLDPLLEERPRLEDLVVDTPYGFQLISVLGGDRVTANLTYMQRRVILKQLGRLERSVDILILDSAAGVWEDVMHFTSFADEVVTVTSPNISALSDAFSFIKTLLKIDPDCKVGVLPNGVRDCYHARNLFNQLNGAAEKRLHYTLADLGFIVEDPYVRLANQSGVPLVERYPDSPAAQCLDEVASALLHKDLFVNQRKGSGFGGLMGEMKQSMTEGD